MPNDTMVTQAQAGRAEMNESNYEFHDVGSVAEFAEGRGRAVCISGSVIAIFRIGDRFFAIDDRCPHAGASLAAGYVHEGTVVCPRHAWRFHLETGAWADYPKIGVETYPIQVRGDRVLVGVPRQDEKAEKASSQA